jgi:hypothetical protein
VKIDVYSYKGFRDSILGDRLIKLINLMLRSAECGLKELSLALFWFPLVKTIIENLFNIFSELVLILDITQ